MAKLSTDELLDAFKEMTLIELSEFVKQFEDTFGVTAAAPVAVAAARPAGGGARRRPRPRSRTSSTSSSRPPATRRSRSSRRCARSQPRPEGGQGPRRRRAQGRPGEGQQGGRRQGQGRPRGRRRQGHRQVVSGRRRTCTPATHHRRAAAPDVRGRPPLRFVPSVAAVASLRGATDRGTGGRAVPGPSQLRPRIGRATFARTGAPRAPGRQTRPASGLDDRAPDGGDARRSRGDAAARHLPRPLVACAARPSDPSAGWTSVPAVGSLPLCAVP